VGLSDDVRRSCAAIAASARHITIDASAHVPDSGVAGLDPALHHLDGPPEEVARAILILDAINFGSGWFDELGTGTNALTARLKGTPWTAPELLALGAADVADRLQLPPAHDLTRLYTRALNDLGAWLGDRTALEAIDTGSAQAMAQSLLAMPLYADPGFYKRAQITANDLVLAGVADYPDVDELTIFADNLVPHVLRMDGVLRYDDQLAARIDAPLEHGSREEIEIRGCAVHACELLAAGLGVPPRTLDNWLWNRGLTQPPGAHRTQTTAY
jgi:Potential Queuosine, Q, salvage protein family